MSTTLSPVIENTALPSHLWEVPYLPGFTLGEFFEECREQQKALYECLNLSCLSSDDWRRFIAWLDNGPAHFESEAVGGRGDAYRRAQIQNPLSRAPGIRKLFQLLKPPEGVFRREEIVLDVLGGNGTLARAMRRLQPLETLPVIVTSDTSSAMIADALAQDLPAIREAAQMLLLGDCTVDGVIFAYGTHHIPPTDRLGTLQEAFRVLKPGGRIVVQDFEEDTPTARWYSELLDRYTLTGHKCKHFTREGLTGLVEQAGFRSSEIVEVYDPFVIPAAGPEEAQQMLVEHVCSLFALKRLFVPSEAPDEAEWKRALETIRPYGNFQSHQLPQDVNAVSEFTVRRVEDGYVAEFPRVALVAVGIKPE